ncbi:T9SS type A sorting domain-containing protein [Polaribacter sp. BAL334]|uniref:PKD domain-containing protein n=1 Tax=Polaribacter sp. BAL334 TaxID=1708178 RepID=UPI0018D1FA67|nr:PKD domain-containing protein [Polaribacter sp. BAL334]MBG7611302.1 T9SS type A sorting domain-containing protein [Polaribacter sp. BAL334]
MKKIIFTFILLASSIVNAQNLITNGTFDDATGWTVVNQYGPDSTNGSVTITGGVVNIGKINPADGGWIHMGLYTSVNLDAGWYQFDMDMTYDGIDTIWGEVYIGSVQPVENTEYGGDQQVIKAYNAWDCGSIKTYSGSAVAAGCDTSSPGKFQITSTGTYYILFRTGGGTFGASGITLDNWSLVADNPQPVANFSEVTSTSNLTATFTNTSTDATSYSWDFGDGSTSSDANPAAHTYAYKGQYLVSLTATSTEGSNTFTKEIFVGAVNTPITDFSFDFSLPTPLRNERLLDYVEAGGVATASGVNDDWWSQINYINNSGIDLSSGDRGFSIKVKGPRTSILTLKVEDGGSEHAVTANYTTPNVWQTLTFDFSSFNSTNNRKIALFFDIQTNFDAGVDPAQNIFQIDDYVFGEFAVLSSSTWTGAVDNDWNTAGNWSNGVPTGSNNAIIPEVTNAPIIGNSTNALVNDLTITEADGLLIASGGTLIVNGTSSGNVTYNRNLPTTNWYLVSSPVSGQAYNDTYVTANGIASGTGANRGIASYTTADNTWSYLQSAGTGIFNNGLGYSVKRSSTGDISFTGTINTADVSVAVSNASNGFNLIGNPFTSHVNSATFLTDNSANLVSETLWVWNQATSSYDTYVTGDSFVLAPAQGFFVRSSNGTNINIAESYQASTSGTFQKSSKTEVKLMMNDGSNNRFVKMYYLDNATKGFDNGYDGETFAGIENSVDVFTNLVENNEGKKFQIQSLPIAEMETMIVPVGVKAAAGKEITFTAEAMNLPGDTKVFLEDRETNTITRLDEANASYKVTLNDALNGTGRFYLHTKASGVLSTEDVVLQNISIYATNKSTLRVVGLTQGKATVKMYNILGKQVMQTSFSSTGVKEISLPKLATGMYIIQLETATGKLNKKIVLE